MVPKVLSFQQRVKALHYLGGIMGIEPALILALMSKETGGVAFCMGEPKINFEQPVFNMERKVHQKFRDRYGELEKLSGCTGSHPRCQDQHIEHGYLRRAMTIHKEHAIQSTGMGVCQTQGWEWFRLGYPSAEAMFEAYRESELSQILGTFLYIQFGRGGRYPLWGPRRAPATHVGPNLKAARKSQREDDMYPFSLKWRGNKRLAREKYAPAMAVFYARWRKELATREGFDETGRIGVYAQASDIPPLADLRPFATSIDALWDAIEAGVQWPGG